MLKFGNIVHENFSRSDLYVHLNRDVHLALAGEGVAAAVDHSAVTSDTYDLAFFRNIRGILGAFAVDENKSFLEKRR